MKREENITRFDPATTQGQVRFLRTGGAGNQRVVFNRSTAFGLALLGASWLGLARPARAAELVVSGPAQCPDTAELAFRVERALGRPLADAPLLRLRVSFEAVGSAGYEARLAVESPDVAPPGSERELNARECGPLGDAVAVAIALAIGVSEVGREASPGSEPSAREPSARARSGSGASVEPVLGDEPPGPPARVAVLEQAAPSAEPAPDERATFTPALTVSAVGDVGSLPGAGVGVGVGVELGWERLAMRATGTLFLDRHVALPGAGETGLGADMGLALGAVSVCSTLLRAARAAAFACAGWELGRLEAIGTGVLTPRREGTLWSAPRVDAGLDWAAGGGPLRLVAQVTAAAPLERDDFYLRDLGSVHRPPAVAGRLSLGVHIDFR